MEQGRDEMRPVADVARDLGVSQDHLTLYGKWKAKVSLQALQENPSSRRRGKLVLVTAMTPTPQGEGKTVTSIGLSMGLKRHGYDSVVCLRQPSLGPVFGVKGGAAGGGKSTVEPMHEINMGLTGDIDAVGTAHNLLAAMLDNHIFHGNQLGIDPRTISWPRAMDMNDRALRQIIVGLGGAKNGVPRETGFIITAASEVMGILSLSKDCVDLKQRLSRIILGYSHERSPVRAGQLKTVGAMAAVLSNAFKPNLVQTKEGTPALIHCGCFGNIAHGTASLVSILLGLQQADYCVVEAGFGSDLGAEKFVDIAARTGDFDVDAAVLVASIRAIKHHGGAPDGNPDPYNLKAMRAGLENLAKHIENIRTMGLNPVIAINKFLTDTRRELELVEEFCRAQDVPSSISTAFEEGSGGAVDLAERVVEAASKGSKAKPVYPLEWSLETKLEAIVTRIYGGDGVDYTLEAKRDTKQISELGLVREPVCAAKTPLSLSDDQTRLGRPRGFKVTVRKLAPAAGAGFNIAYMGDVITMPGLPKRPAAEDINLDQTGIITGLH